MSTPKTYKRCGHAFHAGRACPTCNPRPTVETDAFIGSMQRMIRRLEERAIDDPACIAQVVMLAQRLAEVVNVTIAKSADAYALNPHAAPSMIECASILGISKQSASDRRRIGREIIAKRHAALGVADMTVAKLERKAREAAAQYAAEKMPEWTERRAQLRAV